MKQFYLSVRFLFISAIVLSVLNLLPKISNAQVTQITDYVLYAGNGGPGTTNPGSLGYGLILGSGSTINHGAIGAASMVNLTGGATMSADIFSGGRVIFSNGCSISGRITAANSPIQSGTTFQAGSSQNLSGNIDVNGNIVVVGGSVTGIVTHPTGTTYSGPAIGANEHITAPSLPVLPPLPLIATFPAAGSTNITNTQTISPGAYGSVTLGTNKTLTLHGPGTYIFTAITFSGNVNVIYDFLNTSSGNFTIYVYGDMNLGKLNATMVNGNDATRIYFETHGTGASSSTLKDAVSVSNGSNGGNGSVRFYGTCWAPYAAISIGSGTGSSQFQGSLYSGTQIYIQTGVTLNYMYYVPCSPPVASSGSNSPICAGSTLNLTSGGGTSYSWSGPNGFSSTLQNPSIVGATTAASGNYTVTVTSGTCSATSTTAVTVNALPTATITAGGSTTFCQGGSVSLTSSSGSSYLWSNGATTQSITVSSSGSYTVRVTNSNGCSATSAPTTITVNPLPTATITAGGSTTFCQSGSVTLTASTGTSYLWSSGATTPSINVSSSGSYTVRVTNSNGCSATSAATTITVNPLPVVTASNVNGCAGNAIALSGTPAGGTWSVANPYIGPTTAYTHSFTDVNGCSNTSAPANIIVNPLPTATITAGGSITFCQGGSVLFTASSGSSYLWSSGATTQSITVSSTGNYTVRVTNSNGCSATSAPTTVTVNPLPVVTANNVSGCVGSSIALSGTPVGGTWSVANPYTGSSTTYTHIYVDGNGCTNTSSSATITANPLPNTNAGLDGQMDCSTPSTTLTGSSSTPGAQFSWTASNGGHIASNGNTANPTIDQFGKFTLIVTDPTTGCSASDTALVTFNPCIFPGYPAPPNGKTGNIIGSELTSLYDWYLINGCGNPDSDIYITNESCQVLVEIVYNDGMNQQLYDLLTQSPFNIADTVDNGSRNRIITTFIDFADLMALNNLNITTGIDLINHVRPVFRPIPVAGVAYSLGDVAQKSDLARNGFNVDGSGIKVGIISNSYNTISGNPAHTDVVNGDLPGVGNPNGDSIPVQVLQDYPYGIQTDEGRGMLQIVHDVAPKASLAFRTGFISAGNMALGVRQLQAAGCNVISDDITYITEPFFRDGMIAQAVNDVAALGVSYFTAAGNYGDKSYEGIYTPIAPPGSIIGTAHDFGGGDRFQNVSLTPGSYLLVMQWEDDFYSIDSMPVGTANDLDIYLTYDNGITLFGFNRNNIGGDPIEVLPFNVTQNTSTNILVTRETGTGTNVHFKYIVFKVPAGGFVVNEFNQGNSTIVGQANSLGAITTGAVLYSNTPPFGVSPPTKASFSSIGGTLTYGSPRNKPDICAPNGGNTTVQLGGPNIDSDAFPNFFGTSAAAPHAAGIGALLLHAKQKYYGVTLTPAEVKNLMTSTATEMYSPGFDYLSGYGLVNADSAMRTFAAPIPVLVSLDTIPPGVTLGDTVPAFTLTVTANYITTQSRIVFREDTLPTTWIDGNHLSAPIPSFFGNPPVRICTPAITPSGDDGGCSNVLYFFSPVLRNVVITADNKTKRFGEQLPAFTSTVTVDGQSLADAGLTLEDLGLSNIQYTLPAGTNSMSNTGIYFINPSAGPFDVGLTELYNYIFNTTANNHSGLLTIQKMPLLITPNDRTVDFGDIIDGTTIDFTYTYDDSNILPGERSAFLDSLQSKYEPYIVKQVALVDDRDVYNSSTLSATDLVDLAFLSGSRAIPNGSRAIPNGSRAIPNSEFSDTTFVVDLAYQSLVSYYVNGSQATLTSDVLLMNGSRGIPNGSRAIFNCQSIADGSALANGSRAIPNGSRAIPNGSEGLVNSSDDIDNQSNTNIAVIVHQDDLDVQENPDSLYQLFSINGITGLTSGEHWIVPGGFMNSNFSVTYSPGHLHINPYELKVKADSDTVVYGTAPSYTSVISGYQYDDSAASVFTGSVNYSPASNSQINVGSHTITPSGLTLTNPTNYYLHYVNGALNVTPKTLTATAEDKSKIYGSTNPALTISYTGFAFSDGAGSITPPAISTTASTSSPVGTYPITLSGGSAANYTIARVNGTLTVNPAGLTATADNKSKTYGNANPALTISYSGFVNGDGAGNITQPAITTTASASSPVGTYPISLSGGSAANYTISNVNGTLTVNPATLTATADNKSRNYGFANPALTISYSGFKLSDDTSVISPAIGISTTAITSSPAGNYPISLSGGVASNYNIVRVPGTLTVNAVSGCAINSPSSLPLCGSAGNILSATGPAGYVYSWGVSGTGWLITSGSSTLSVTYTAGGTGTTGVFTLTVSAPVTNFVVSTCSLSVSTSCGAEYCTYSQFFWGNLTAMSCDGTLSSNMLPGLLNTQLVNGDGNREIIIGTGDGSCMQSKLPSGSSSGQLPNGIVNCTNATGSGYLNSGKFRSYLLGSEIALALGVRGSAGLGSLHITGPYLTTYGASSCVNGSAVAGTRHVYAIPQSVVTYLGANNTIANLITLANQALGGTYNAGGNNSPSYDDLANACASITAAFDSCRILVGFSSSSAGSRVENTDVSTGIHTNLNIYPNPSSGNTTVSFIAAQGSHASIDVYSISGALVSNAYDDNVAEDGLYSVELNGSLFAKGIYFVRLTVDENVSIGKLVIIK